MLWAQHKNFTNKKTTPPPPRQKKNKQINKNKMIFRSEFSQFWKQKKNYIIQGILKKK